MRFGPVCGLGIQHAWVNGCPDAALLQLFCQSVSKIAGELDGFNGVSDLAAVDVARCVFFGG